MSLRDRDLRQELIDLVADLDERATLELVRQRVRLGHDPLQIIQDCEQGMRIVGERYEQHEYFLAGLIMAGEIFRQVVAVVQPSMAQALAGHGVGRVLIGTVQGDIHDIGKDIVHFALRCFGFTVEDLGVDVPPSRFLERAILSRPDIIGLSCILTSSFTAVQETVRTLRTAAPSYIQSIPIIVGGSQLSDDICRFVGADFWVTDGMEGVRLCQRIVKKA